MTESTALAEIGVPHELAEGSPPALYLKEARTAERFFDFFTANIRNKHTRRAYYNAACRFLNAFNPLQGIKIPAARETADTYAYNLSEIKTMLAALKEPAWTVILTAALTGLCKAEIRGLYWEDFDGKQLSVKRSVWNSVVSEPKTKRRKAPVPVVNQLAEALEAHRLRMGKLAVGPIFRARNGKPLNLDNLVRRVIVPALSRCTVCRKLGDKHKPEGHVYQCDQSLPQWHGWGTPSGAALRRTFTPRASMTKPSRRSCDTATSASRRISTSRA